MRLFFVRSTELMMALPPSPGKRSPGLGHRAFVMKESRMPAYIQHHDIETVPVICPGCIGLLPMYVRDVKPHWSMAKIDFIYECADCGAEVRRTVTKPH